MKRMHDKPTHKISFANTGSKCTQNRQIKQLTLSLDWCLMNELSFIRNSAASFYHFEQKLSKVSCQVSYKRKFIHQTPARRERELFYLPALSAFWTSVGEAYFICQFSVHFSHTFVFSQKLLFWSFFNFFIFLIKWTRQTDPSVSYIFASDPFQFRWQKQIFIWTSTPSGGLIK